MVLFAFSIQDQVEKYGAYVGLAAFLGLAVLTVLYFAQARELKRLRDWAGRAPERAQELEARVVATADEARRAQVAEGSGTVGPATPVEQPAPAVAEAGGNGRPAGTPAPIPIGPRPAVAVAAAAAQAEATAVAAPAAAPAEAESGGDEEPAAEAAPVPANGAGQETQLHDTLGGDEAPPAEEAPDEEPAAEPEPEPATSGNGVAAEPVIPRATPRPQPRPEPAAAPRPEPAAAPLRATPAASRTVPAAPRRHRGPGSGSSSAARITALVLAGVVVVAALAFGATQLFGGDEPKPAPNVTQPPQSSADAGSGGAGPTAAQARPDTVVAILNGTPTEGLASGARDKLVAKGYSDQEGMIRTGNNTDQQRQDSAVFFAPGKRRQARDVASILGITAAPQAVDEDTLALANATGSGGKSADVVAVLGLDQSP
jgi:LytR cell envelope-related transcriptional attenuator